MSNIVTKTLGGMALLAMALPVFAAHNNSVGYVADKPLAIGGQQLPAGEYEFVVGDGASQVQVKKDGHVVATVPCKWVQLSQKARFNQVLVTSDAQVSELEFSGKTDAATLTTN